MPENDDEMGALIDLVEKYHPDPDPEYCEACEAANEMMKDGLCELVSPKGL